MQSYQMKKTRESNALLCCLILPTVALIILFLIHYYSREEIIGIQDTFGYKAMHNQIHPTKLRQDLREPFLKRGTEEIDDARKHLDEPFRVGFFGKDQKLKQEANALKEDNLNQLPKFSQKGLFVMPRLEGENVISMTLYGSNLKYTIGAIRNAELAKKNFPGWKLRLYMEKPSDKPKYRIVPQTVIDQLKLLGADVYYVEPDEYLVPPMMWRFLIADDKWVDHFIVRDTDARLTERDAAAVYEWVKSGQAFHCIRDHPSHAHYALSGGMWGGKPKELAALLQHTWQELMKGLGEEYLDDMNFLNTYIWPKVKNHTYCSDSVSCDVYPSSHPFPVPRYGYEHVGQVVSEHGLGRPVDINILRETGENAKCVPQGFDNIK